MKFHPDLSEFNFRFARAVRDLFAEEVSAEQSIEGDLLFRGPDPRDRTTCTHVAVHLPQEVRDALEFEMPLQRELMIRHLVDSLAAQVRAGYDRNRAGESVLRVVGTPAML